MPIGVCEILDTWHTAGLRGTGSHDWQVTDVFVPEEQSFPILFDGPSAPGCLCVRDFAAYAGPRVAAVALGIARDAIDACTALARIKTPALATSPLATQHTTHERVATTTEFIQRKVIEPARELAAILAGLRRGLEVLVAPSPSPIDRSYGDDEMFIG